ncbi:TRAP dicarboxylate transporter substrate-binding protein DctP subunit (plasmid) [Rhizobium phaseoli]|uniref:TRAP transporter substrate-binding protein n=1 Tax=Rhizobium phaseoli TaxID=396 RepID=UPI0007EB3792|nr:TRAP transporter substrate-binding protein [Rhizobium phaseoli]ANL51019.1 TRAP dicarboxylate transporter substrate-binding protein DctP subunit [Rhizobium phaseoli]
MSTSITRRAFGAIVASTAISAALPLRFAHAAEYTFKMGTNVPATHPLNVHLSQAADKVKTETNGRFELQLFPNNQLGADSDMLSQLRSGALECFLNSGVNVLSTLIPAAAISGVGFAFKGYSEVWSALDGKLGANLRGQINKGGLVVMDKVWDNGFRMITNSSKPITKPNDLEGMKIRVPVSALWLSLFKALGAAPTGMNFAEVYTALQTKVVDGQENPPAIIAAAKLNEVQTYASVTNHMWDGWWFLMNRRAWGQVPPDLQETVSKIINESCVAQRADVAQKNIDLRKDLAASGMIFNEVDPAPFRSKLSEAGFYKEWRGKFGEEAWALLEESVGKLA